MVDKRIYIIAALAVVGIILTFIKESTKSNASDQYEAVSSSKNEIPDERIVQMADTTLRSLGVKKENIRPIKNRNDMRVFYSQGFDVLNFVGAMKDSLENFNATVFSVDNAKERSSVVQIKKEDVILKSFVFSKEPVTKPKTAASSVQKKGVSPSVKKQIKRQ